MSNETGKTKRPDDSVAIDHWAKKRNVYDSFKRLIERFQDNIIVLSYRDRGIPDQQTIDSLLRVFKRKVKIYSTAQKYALSRRESRELLFVAR